MQHMVHGAAAVAAAGETSSSLVLFKSDLRYRCCKIMLHGLHHNMDVVTLK